MTVATSHKTVIRHHKIVKKLVKTHIMGASANDWTKMLGLTIGKLRHFLCYRFVKDRQTVDCLAGISIYISKHVTE